MNKKELVATVAKSTGLSQKVIDESISKAFIAITNAVTSGATVVIPGFGQFFQVLQKGRTGKILGTDKTYTTSDKMVPKFKVAKRFKDYVAAGK